MGKYRETWDVSTAVGRLICAVGKRVAADGNPEELEELQKLQATLDEALDAAVIGLRSLGFSDSDIGKNLRAPDGTKGVSRQAVAQRWPH